jgi:hypothetical protein
MSHKTSLSSGLGFLVVCGSVWGLSEAGLGLALAACAKTVSGSIMTGVALFFIGAAWARTKRVAGPAIVIGFALGFKLIDALLLGLPLKHGAVANPMFAFVAEGIAFLVVVPFLAEAWRRRTVGRAFLGGASALLAVNLFPLAKFATGIPACVVAGGTMPLSLYYAPIAVAAALVAVPLGFLAAERGEALESQLRASGRILVPAAAAGLCLAAQVLLRLV